MGETMSALNPSLRLAGIYTLWHLDLTSPFVASNMARKLATFHSSWTCTHSSRGPLSARSPSFVCLLERQSTTAMAKWGGSGGDERTRVRASNGYDVRSASRETRASRLCSRMAASLRSEPSEGWSGGSNVFAARDASRSVVPIFLALLVTSFSFSLISLYNMKGVKWIIDRQSDRSRKSAQSLPLTAASDQERKRL